MKIGEKVPIYNQDWFSEAIPVFELVLKDLKGKNNLVFMEIGSYEGMSAVWLLENILTGKNCGLFCIDTFEGSRAEKDGGLIVDHVKPTFLSNLKSFEGKYQLIEGYSQDFLRTRDFDNKIDCIYIDGSHRADDTMEDLINGYRVLKRGGIMLVDDYMWNFSRYPAHEVPKTAIDAFMMIFRDKMKVKLISYKTVVFEKL